MIVLLGSTGYIGQAFERELEARGWAYKSLSRSTVDYTRFDVLLKTLRDLKATFLVNCAGYTGKPNVDACETAKADTLVGNALLPLIISNACSIAGVPWGNVSSGCIFAGGRITDANGTIHHVKNLLKPEVKRQIAENPGCLSGFTEEDAPNFSFRDEPCSFYSGTKALGEEAMSGDSNSYIWRLRIPFDEYDNSRNYLSKVQRYAKVYDNINSFSHRGDFAWACLELWAVRAPFGIYNVTNPGHLSARQVIGMIQKRLKLNRSFEFWENDDDFYKMGAKTPRSNCVLDSGKAAKAGVRMRPVEEAIDNALERWKPEVTAAAK